MGTLPNHALRAFCPYRRTVSSWLPSSIPHLCRSGTSKKGGRSDTFLTYLGGRGDGRRT